MAAIAVCDIRDISREEWLSKRKQGIGGSDVGAIMGFNPYRTAFDVYVDKTTAEIEDKTPSEAAYWGTVLEDIVSKEFEKRSGKRVRKKNAVLQHSEYPYMLANIDREVVGERAILECKTASVYLADEWKNDEIPASYILQVQHYLAVTGYDKAYIAVLIGGQEFLYKTIARDEEIINTIIREIKNFWENHVLTKLPPENVTFSKETASRLFKHDNGETVRLDEDMDKDFKALKEVKDTIKELEIQQENIECKIKLALGENQQGKTDNYSVSWKNQTRTSVDLDKLKEEHSDIYKQCLKTEESRVFRFKEVK